MNEVLLSKINYIFFTWV